MIEIPFAGLGRCAQTYMSVRGRFDTSTATLTYRRIGSYK